MTLHLPDTRRNKFHAKRMQVGDVWFDSKREAGRFVELKYLEKAGEIYDLALQPSFDLHVSPRWNPSERIKVGRFTADFQYRDRRDSALHIEDVKSKPTRTEAYRLRKRMVEAEYGVTISEV